MRLRLALVVLGSLSVATPLPAQVAPGRPPAAPGAAAPVDDAARYTPPWHVVFADGEVEVTRNGVTERLAAGQALVTGDRLRSVNGRVEARTEYLALFIDAESMLDFPADGVVRLRAGRVRALVADNAGLSTFDGQPLRIETPTALVRLIEVGDVGITVSLGTRGDETIVTARLGRTELSTDREVVIVEARDSVLARAFDRPVRIDGVPRAADFDLWVDARVGAGQPTASAGYLPAPIAVYSRTLDAYGTWGVEPDYGPVWYPTVEVGWRPYSVGSWRYAGHYGWMWVGGGPWAWPTHHYGRWGWRANRWFWAPGPVWGPAWVAWGTAPGYVTWCPLGWNNYPVFSLSVSFGTGWYGGYGGYYGSYYPWRGWTVMPARHFRHGVHVSRYALDGRRVRDLDGRHFEMYRRPPASSGEFRADAGARTGGAPHRAVPRSGWSSDVDGRAAPAGMAAGTSGRSRVPGVRAPGAAAAPDDRTGGSVAASRRAPDGTWQRRGEGGAPAEGGRAATPRSAGRTVPGDNGRAAGGAEAPRASATPYRTPYTSVRGGGMPAETPAPRSRSSVPRAGSPDVSSSPYRSYARPTEVSPSRSTSPGAPSSPRYVMPGSDAYRAPSPQLRGAPRASAPSSQPPARAPQGSTPSYRPRSETAAPSFRNAMPSYRAPSYRSEQARPSAPPRMGSDSSGRSVTSPRGGASHGSVRAAAPSRSGGGGAPSGSGRRATPRR